MSTRYQRRQLKHDNEQWPETLARVPLNSFQEAAGKMTKPPIEVWRSRYFLVQIFSEDNGIMRMTVCRTEINETGERWKDNITWDDLQRLKRECFYGHRDAVEIYPRDVDIVNVANMRHLWLLPEPLPFGWRKP